MWLEAAQTLLYGIVHGSVITLGAIGVSLVFAILRFAHFAHGDLMTVGAYFAFFFVATLGWPLPAAFVVAALGTIVVAVLADRGVYRRLSRARSIVLLVASIGVALILRNLVLMLWGPDNLVYSRGIELPLQFFGIRMKVTQIYALGGAVALVAGLHAFLQYTRPGKAMRALADDHDLATITGINADRVILWMWAIAAVFACAAGVFLGVDTRLRPDLGWNLLLPIFAAAIVGGLGRPYGAIAGAMVIGIALEMSTLVITPSYKPAVAFAIMVLVLILRPTGIVGART